MCIWAAEKNGKMGQMHLPPHIRAIMHLPLHMRAILHMGGRKKMEKCMHIRWPVQLCPSYEGKCICPLICAMGGGKKMHLMPVCNNLKCVSVPFAITDLVGRQKMAVGRHKKPAVFCRRPVCYNWGTPYFDILLYGMSISGVPHI